MKGTLLKEMKTTADLARHLARQWQNPDLREARLIANADWPFRIPIGRPASRIVAQDWQSLITHIRDWREAQFGRVIWKSIFFRSIGESVEFPIVWEIGSADDWILAAANPAVTEEYKSLKIILASTDALFHPLFVRRRSTWNNKPLLEIIKATELVNALDPGCAHGVPLRALSIAGIDSKFFERHRSLIIQMLDLRFDGEASKQGLETFLDAWQSDSWLLVADLDGKLLPFSQMRVRSSDLLGADFTVRNLLVIENERCLHLLPRNLSGTIVILGTGNNLGWLAADWVRSARVGYWGDIDTWGLTLLANARSQVSSLTALLMSRHIFEEYAAAFAVTESIVATSIPPKTLTQSESELYVHLLKCEKGRFEQEFMPREAVYECLKTWLESGF